LLDSYKLLAQEAPSHTALEFHLVFDGVTKEVMSGRDKLGNEVSDHVFVGYLDAAINKESPSLSEASLAYSSRKAMSTPYGWCGVKKGFCGTASSLFVHYKDPVLVRKRKRWSQVLYLLLLQARLRSKRWDTFYADGTAHRRVFVLMTDGDVIFKPRSVSLMLDSALRDERVAGVCARLVPQGHGMIAAVQSFEYCVAHWLQKTTENVLGSVLCASSCFSLFRLCALESVLCDFAKVPRTCDEYQQYEQGPSLFSSVCVCVCLLLMTGAGLTRGFCHFFNRGGSTVVYSVDPARMVVEVLCQCACTDLLSRHL
jgi:hypothetical protein